MKLLMATHNLNKVKDIATILPKGFQLFSLADLNYNNPIDEPFDSLHENARIKSETIFNIFKIPCFADDSGLFVDSLNGNPGVKSARYAGDDATAEDNIKKLIANLSFKEIEKAHFKTVISYTNERETVFFEGAVKGKIIEKPIGNNGFGYDPVFVPDGFDISFAQMDIQQKNKISHRKIAFGLFIEHLTAKSM